MTLSDEEMRFSFRCSPDQGVGDFGALLRQLDQPSDPRTVTGGYATLMARVTSAEFRRRAGHFS